MRKLTAIAVTMAALSGCYTLGQSPKIGQTRVTPETLTPDSKGLITVVIHDSDAVVDRVRGEVQVDPPIPIPLYDDGTHGDTIAADGVWSFEVPVPLNAPLGTYEIVFTAYNDDGLPVEVRTDDREVIPLQSSVPFVIAYPKE